MGDVSTWRLPFRDGERAPKNGEIGYVRDKLLKGRTPSSIADDIGLIGPYADHYVRQIGFQAAGLNSTRKPVAGEVWVPTEWYYGRRLTEADRQNLEDRVLRFQSLTKAAAEMGLEYNTAQRIAKARGLKFTGSNQHTGQWVMQRKSQEGQVMAKPVQVSVTSEHAASICKMLLEGKSTRELAQVFGRSDSWICTVAAAHGLEFNKESRVWQRKEQEQTSVDTNDGWNMSTEDYEALLTPDRERGNGNGAAPAAASQVEVSDSSADLGSIEDDIKEALDLLARAEQQRKDDLAMIEEYKAANRKVVADAEGVRAQSHELRETIRNLETKVAQLETENKRLMDKLKGEISRGLLRQGMDNLRKVL